MKNILTIIFLCLTFSNINAQWVDGGSFLYTFDNESIHLKNNRSILFKSDPTSIGGFSSSIVDLSGVLNLLGSNGISIGESIIDPKININTQGHVGIGGTASSIAGVAVKSNTCRFVDNFDRISLTISLGTDESDEIGLFSNNDILISPDRGDGQVRIDGRLEVETPIGPSDQRLKKDIAELSSGLDIITALRPVSYRYIDRDNQTNIGLIAQEVEKVIPSITSNLSRSAEDGTPLKGIKYQELIPVLIKAMQEQQEIIEQQQKQLDAQKKSIANIIRTYNN